MLFIFDMGGVVCGTNTNASHFAIHAVRFTDADSLFREWEPWMK